LTSPSEPTDSQPLPPAAGTEPPVVPAPDEEPPAREPIFNIPRPLAVVVALMTVIHLLRVYVLSDQLDRGVIIDAAFFPIRYTLPLSEQGWVGYFLGPFGHSLLHGSALHLIFNSLWLVVFAAPLVARIGAWRFALLWLTSAGFSAFFFGLLSGWPMTYLIGASGVVSATVGAACRFSVPLSGSRQMRYAQYAPRLGIVEAMTHRSVLVFTAIWLLSNMLVLVGIGMPSGSSGADIAWQAHLGGFLFGYLTFGLFDPPIRRS
jgi:membrane associated rhomboid family serine protease